MEPYGHRGCDFRHILESLKLEFSKLYQTQGHHQPFSKHLLAIASYNLMVKRFPLVSVQTFGIPANPYLISTLIFFWIQL